MKRLQVYFKSRLERSHYINLNELSEIEVFDNTVTFYGLSQYSKGLKFQFKMIKTAFEFADAFAMDKKKVHFVVYLNDHKLITDWE